MGPLLEMTSGDLDECLNLNLKSFFHASSAVAPYMLSQGKGTILNMASASGQGASPGNGLYGAAKAGDDFIVLDTEKEAKTLSENRAQESIVTKNPLTFVTQESAFSNKSAEELNLIIKSDVHGPGRMS